MVRWDNVVFRIGSYQAHKMQRNISRLLADTAFIIILFLPGFVIGWGEMTPWKYICFLAIVTVPYVLVTKLIPKFFVIVLTIPIILLQLANIGSYVQFGLPFEYGAFMVMLNSDIEEVRDYITLAGALVWLIAPLLIIFYGFGLWWYVRSPIRFNSTQERLSGLLLIAVAVVGLVSFYDGKGRYDLYSYIHIYRLAVHYNVLHSNLARISKQREVIFQKRLASQGPRSSKNLDDIVIIVIGESVRRSSLGLYGYHRKTTPHLDKRRHELLIFNKAISPATNTLLSTAHTMTPLTVDSNESLLENLSLVGEAKLAGFRTTWITNTNLVGRSSSTISGIAKDAHELLVTRIEGKSEKFHSTDAEILPLVDNVIKNGEGKNKFLVIGTRGSHTLYTRRAPDGFRRFLPMIDVQTPYHVDLRDEIVNAYDNSILFLDWFLEQLIRRLEASGRPATLFYFSDHGEVILDDGKSFGHGHSSPKKLLLEVPFLIWQSKNRNCKSDKMVAYANEPINLAYFFDIAKYVTCMDKNLPKKLYDPHVMALKRTNIFNYEDLPDY